MFGPLFDVQMSFRVAGARDCVHLVKSEQNVLFSSLLWLFPPLLLLLSILSEVWLLDFLRWKRKDVRALQHGFTLISFASSHLIRLFLWLQPSTWPRNSDLSPYFKAPQQGPVRKIISLPPSWRTLEPSNTNTSWYTHHASDMLHGNLMLKKYNLQCVVFSWSCAFGFFEFHPNSSLWTSSYRPNHCVVSPTARKNLFFRPSTTTMLAKICSSDGDREGFFLQMVLSRFPDGVDTDTQYHMRIPNPPKRNSRLEKSMLRPPGLFLTASGVSEGEATQCILRNDHPPNPRAWIYPNLLEMSWVTI